MMCGGVMEIESMLSRFQADNNDVKVDEVITLIYQVFEDRVFRSARGFTVSSIVDAQDMAGNFWLWFVEKEVFKKYDTTRQSFEAWFSVVLRHKCIDFWVRPTPNPYSDVSIDDDAHEVSKVADPKVRDPLENLLNAEMEQEIQDALGKLSPRQRDIFIRKRNGDSVKQIASDLDVRPETVKSHLKTARRKLRKLLKRVHDESTD